jgi:hypothetical protein
VVVTTLAVVTGTVDRPVQYFSFIAVQPLGADKTSHHEDVEDADVPQVIGSILDPHWHQQPTGGISTPLAIEDQVVVVYEQSVVGTGQPTILE